MSAAEVIPIREREDVHPLTPLVKEARENGCSKDKQIAEWILAAEPDIWLALSHHERVSLIAAAVNRWVTGSPHERRTQLKGVWGTSEASEVDGSREAVMRITAVGTAAWSSTWGDVGGKETRDLDANDIAIIVRQYRRREVEMRARALWLLKLLALMRQHNCKVAGDLEKKKLPLPSVEVDGEAGE